MKFSNNQCTITDKWNYNNMRVIWLENDLIKIGVLVGRGADIFEFRYKPQDLNFLLRLPGDIKNPSQVFAQKRDTNNQMEDYYYGGWQETLPNSEPFNYRGASLGQHGEVWGIPWDYAILEDNDEQVSFKCWTRPMRTPLLVEKTLIITKNSPILNIKASVKNEGHTHYDMVWGQHIAFGLPFLEDETKININATKMIAEPIMDNNRRFKPGIETNWPAAVTVNGQTDDASIIPKAGASPYLDLSYLSGFGEVGKYTIMNTKKQIGFGLEWDASFFKYVWCWQDRYGTLDAPFWGNAYTVALEPWTTKWTDDPQSSIDRGEWLRLEAMETVNTELNAFSVDESNDQ